MTRSSDTCSVNATARRGRPRLVAAWSRLTLWPRLAIGVTVGFLVLFAGFSLLGIRSVDASTTRILHERLAITQELADDFDGLLEHRFSDLAAFDARPAAPCKQCPGRRGIAHDRHSIDVPDLAPDQEKSRLMDKP